MTLKRERTMKLNRLLVALAATLAATLFLLCFGCIPITAQLLGFHNLQPVHQDRT